MSSDQPPSRRRLQSMSRPHLAIDTLSFDPSFSGALQSPPGPSKQAQPVPQQGPEEHLPAYFPEKRDPSAFYLPPYEPEPQSPRRGKRPQHRPQATPYESWARSESISTPEGNAMWGDPQHPSLSSLQDTILANIGMAPAEEPAWEEEVLELMEDDSMDADEDPLFAYNLGEDYPMAEGSMPPFDDASSGYGGDYGEGSASPFEYVPPTHAGHRRDSHTSSQGMLPSTGGTGYLQFPMFPPQAGPSSSSPSHAVFSQLSPPQQSGPGESAGLPRSGLVYPPRPLLSHTGFPMLENDSPSSTPLSENSSYYSPVHSDASEGYTIPNHPSAYSVSAPQLTSQYARRVPAPLPMPVTGPTASTFITSPRDNRAPVDMTQMRRGAMSRHDTYNPDMNQMPSYPAPYMPYTQYPGPHPTASSSASSMPTRSYDYPNPMLAPGPSTRPRVLDPAGYPSPHAPSGSRAFATSAIVKEEPEVETTKPRARRRKTEDSSDEPLPAKSLLNPPKKPPSAWQLYFTDYVSRHRQRAPGERINVAQEAKDASQTYVKMPEAEKEKYQARAAEAKKEYERQLSLWQRTLRPDDIRAENIFRTAQRRAGKSRKTNLKDPNAPKKPLSAYFLFQQDIRLSETRTKEIFGDVTETTAQSVKAAEFWRALPDEEKKPYLERAERTKQAYEAARQIYEERVSRLPAGTDLTGVWPSDEETRAYFEERSSSSREPFIQRSPEPEHKPDPRLL